MQMGDIHVSARYVSEQYARHMVKRESGGGGEEDMSFRRYKLIHQPRCSFITPHIVQVHSTVVYVDEGSQSPRSWSNDWEPCCLPFWGGMPFSWRGRMKEHPGSCLITGTTCASTWDTGKIPKSSRLGHKDASERAQNQLFQQIHGLGLHYSSCVSVASLKQEWGAVIVFFF